MNKHTIRLATGLGWLLAAIAVIAAGRAWGQGADGSREAELARTEAEREARQEEVEAKLEEAQARLEEAAQEVAELSARLSEDALFITLRALDEIGPRPMLGVNVGSVDEGVGGVRIVGVTPGGPADKAGLRSGDVLVAIDDEDLIGEEAGDRLTAFMDSVEAGQEVTVRYRRDGEEDSVSVVPEEMDPFHFAIGSPGSDWEINLQGLEELAKLEELEQLEELAEFEFSAGAHGVHLGMGFPGRWRSLEMVSLTPELGDYFAAQSGLLVVRAPADETLGLRDGDVIVAIDGREPTSPKHAMRILRSYEAGETIRFSIIRKKQSETLEVVLPEATVGQRWEWSFPDDAAPVAVTRKVIRTPSVGT